MPSSITTARISRILKHKVPVHPNAYGEKIDIVGDQSGLPVLEVYVFGRRPVRYPLNLLRYEFLMRHIGRLPSQGRYAIGWSNRHDMVTARPAHLR